MSGSTAAQKEVEIGIDRGHLLRVRGSGIPSAGVAVLSQQEAAEAVARGVAVAFVRLLV